MAAKAIVKVKVNSRAVIFTRSDGRVLETRTYTPRSDAIYDVLGYAIGGADIVARKETTRGATYDILPPYHRRRVKLKLNAMR